MRKTIASAVLALSVVAQPSFAMTQSEYNFMVDHYLAAMYAEACIDLGFPYEEFSEEILRMTKEFTRQYDRDEAVSVFLDADRIFSTAHAPTLLSSNISDQSIICADAMAYFTNELGIFTYEWNE